MIRRLKELRKQRGLTQKDLAKKAGVSVAMVSQIEAGTRKIMSDAFLKILRAMHVDVPEFYSVYDASTQEVIEMTLQVMRGKNHFIRNYLKIVLMGLVLVQQHGKKNHSIGSLEMLTTGLMQEIESVKRMILSQKNNHKK